MFTATVELPVVLKQQVLYVLSRRTQSKPFIIDGVDINTTNNNSKLIYQLKINGTWQCHRATIQNQLIYAGVITPELTPLQELAVKKIEQLLETSIDWSNDCIIYHLLGVIDQFMEEGLITLPQYINLRKEVSNLPNLFEEDFKHYFGTSVPEDCYKMDDDC